MNSIYSLRATPTLPQFVPLSQLPRTLFLRLLNRLQSFLLLFVSLCMPVQAHERDVAGADVAGAAITRLIASSDLFEVVGTIEGSTLTLHLGGFLGDKPSQPSTPVKNAMVEIESGKIKGVATSNEDGSYRFRSDLFRQRGTVPLAITIANGDDMDLLAANLQLPGPNRNQLRKLDAPLLSFWQLVFLASAMLGLVATLTLRDLARMDPR